MNKSMIVMAFISCFLIFGMAEATDIHIKDNNTGNMFDIKGCFDSKICEADPGSPLFSERIEGITDTLFYKYTYLGKTSGKIFDVLYSLPGDRGQQERTLHFQMAPGKIFSLLPAEIHPGCKSSDSIGIKLIGFNGSNLKYQIILPSCLKGK